MDELSREASVLLEASCASSSPSADTRQRIRAAIATGLAAGIVAPAVAASGTGSTAVPTAGAQVVATGTAKLVVVAAVTGLIGFGAGALFGHAVGSRATPAVAEIAPREPRVQAPARADEHVASTPSVVAPAHDAPAPAEHAPRTAVRERHASRDSAPSKPVAEAEASATAYASTLAAELALIRAADAARSGADAVRALAELDEHATRFPDGQLAQERESLRVLALCDLHRVEDARTAAAAFFARWPDSPHASRLKGSCAIENR